jgi:RNA polymerase sigma-70 factor (ECF subfamily)
VSTLYVDDAELVGRARQGDSAAFGELVDRHRTAVYRAALAALRSHADAEDTAQDAFLLAFRRLDSFRGEASFRTWLLTITWNQAMNRRRSVARMLKQLVELAHDDERAPAIASVAAGGPTPEEMAADRQLRRAVRREIGRLTPRLRDALVLAQSGTYSYEEIAAMLKAPLGTIKWRVSEARRVIRTRMRAQGFGNVADGR